ncbi:MAG: ParB/RepB/Spo0J family partition protein [Clostridia bacterium]|nr:ParB/RepB/Spo0J family partition protein [Clostridia bacterium]
MAQRKGQNFSLEPLDDFFKTDEERKEDKLSKIRDIPLDMIDEFPDHPFKVRDDEDMQNLVESIRVRGVITPATVRKKEDGRYEMISGHRRKRACELLGKDTLRCEVVELSRDEATVLMVESNFQRSEILPSEKAFAYKMRYEAMKHQGKRVDITSGPVDQKLTTAQMIAENTTDGERQVRRYIRLTYLVPELLEYVDEGRIKMRPAVELSYLDEEAQRDIVEEIDLNEATPSHAQTIKMRRFFEDGRLTTEIIQSIMEEEKPNQRDKIVIRGEKVKKLIPQNLKISEREEYICKALEHYTRFLARQRDDRSER